ncbi:hypothetical protein V7075_23945 [Neobacillus drentensis]
MNHLSNGEFGGYCAIAMSLGKKDVTCEGKHYVLQNGKKYHFSNPIARFCGGYFLVVGKKQNLIGHPDNN